MIPASIHSFYQRRMALVETSVDCYSEQPYSIDTSSGEAPSLPINQLWAALLHATFLNAASAVPKRAASICIDGTPVVFSLKLTHKEEAPAFRALIEPGGTGITLPQQVDLCLHTTEKLLQLMGWQQAAEQINRIIAHVFPADQKALENWWGGIWLGCAVSEENTEIRMYLNLRHGDALQRWQRVADVLTEFSDEAIEPVLKQLISQVSPHAIPVGLGIVISKTVRGIRLYTGMHAPDENSILQCISGDVASVTDDIHWCCENINRQFGGFAKQSVTLGYDFHLSKEGILQPLISRTKIDIACQRFARAENFLPFLQRAVKRFQFNNKQLPSFLSDLDECFGGTDIEYISIGVDNGIDHFTVYAKPYSLQTCHH